MFVYKIDKELALKLMDKRDADRIFSLTDRSRDHLREWLPWLDSTTKPDDTRQYIEASLKGFAAGKSVNTVILYKGKAAGIAGFNEINSTRKTAYIGYWLGEEFQGKGIMSRTVTALTDYAFRELEMDKVEIRAAVANKKSRNIPERLGFIEEGRIRQAEWLYDHYVDAVIYGMLAEEWQNQQE